MARGRISLGGAVPSSNAALLDVTSRINSSTVRRSTRASSVTRRMSIGCTAESANSETSKQDRRALLEEWRRQRNNPATASSNSNTSMNNTRSYSSEGEGSDPKRARTSYSVEDATPPIPSSCTPPIPPSSISNSQGSGNSIEGTTAVERFRMRRMMAQQQHQQNSNNNENLPPLSFSSGNSTKPSSTLPPHPLHSQTPLSSNNGASLADGSVTTPLLTSPAFNRRLTMISGGGGGAMRSASRDRRASRRRSFSLESSMKTNQCIGVVPASLSSNLAVEKQSKITRSSANTTPMNQAIATTTKPSPMINSVDSTDTIETAGLKSRIREMQTQVNQLQQEKLDLTKSKAPLEARLRQRDDAWKKEQARFLSEIEELKKQNKEWNEKNRKLEMQKSQVEEERSQYKYQALKNAAKNSSSDNCAKNESSSPSISDGVVTELQGKLRDYQDEIRDLRLEIVSLESELDTTKRQLENVCTSHEEVQQELDEFQNSSEQSSEAKIQLQVLTTEHIATSAQLNAVLGDLAALKSSSKAELEEKEKEWKVNNSKLKFEISVLKANADIAKSSLDSTSPRHSSSFTAKEEAILKARVQERDARISELEIQASKNEVLRRQLHNRIQELRGNIRVFVRTRPFLPADGLANTSCVEVCPDGESLKLKQSSEGKKQESVMNFHFDRAFPPSTGQDTIFQEVSDFVQSALDGYHVCLFSYGQTGSGKTHTMQGSGNGAMRGIIPRAVEQVLMAAQHLQDQKWCFDIKASFLEIYNEELNDLLLSYNSDSSHNKVSSSRCGGGPSTRSRTNPKLSIKRDARGKSYVDNLTSIAINTQDLSLGMSQLESLMSTAARSRSVASTNMNAQSSRSHSVFILHLYGNNEETGCRVHGALNLCDLAGSERLNRSLAGSSNVRLKETQAINKSLAALGDVFNALGNKSKHVPYRNTKLTYLLQDCLSGDGKALMFVNLSPVQDSAGESLCSLRFAQRVNQVELGKPTKHVKYSGVR